LNLEPPTQQLRHSEPEPGEWIGDWWVQDLVSRPRAPRMYRLRDRSGKPAWGTWLRFRGQDPQHWHQELSKLAQHLSELRHPNTVRVLSWVKSSQPGGFLLVSQSATGHTLAQDFRDQGRRSERDAAAIAMDIARSLADAHSQGVVHGGLNPHHIWIDPQTRQARVADYGLHRALGNIETMSSARSAPTWLSPEQIQDGAVTAATDVYVFGTVFFQLLSGQPPFQAPTTLGVMSAHLHRTPPRLADVHPALSAIASRCLSKDPSARFRNGQEVRSALREAIREIGGLTHDLPTLHEDPGEPTPVPIWRVAAPWIAVGAGVATLLFAQVFLG